MVDQCLTKPCALCGKIIHGANWYCPNCEICVCLYCGVYEMKELECPKCKRKLLE